MQLTIKEGTKIYTADGERLGAVDRVVMDPLTRSVSHVVVRKGVFFPEDKVIPLEAIASAIEERINLDPDVDPADLPPFEETHYLPLEDGEESLGDGSIPLVYYGPYAMVTPVLNTVSRTVVERNIPEDTVALRGGAPVIDRDNVEIGRFDELLMTETGVVTHLVMTRDLGLVSARRAIPISWVEFATDEKVKLGVTSRLVDASAEYEPDRPHRAP